MMDKKAFTLVELIVAITIVGILSLLIIPRVIQYINTTKDNILLYNLATMRRAIARYARDHDGYYPRSLMELVKNNYLTEIPTDPYTNTKDWEIAMYSAEVGNVSPYKWVKSSVANNSNGYAITRVVVPLTMYNNVQLNNLGKSASDFGWDKHGICNVRIGNPDNPYYHDSNFDSMCFTGDMGSSSYYVNLGNNVGEYPDYSKIKNWSSLTSQIHTE